MNYVQQLKAQLNAKKELMKFVKELLTELQHEVSNEDKSKVQNVRVKIEAYEKDIKEVY